MRFAIDSDSGLIPFYSAGEFLDDDSPTPPDPIGPGILGFGGLLVLGGARNVGKTAFLLSWMMHMAAGCEFLGMRPARPLRIFHLQADSAYPYFRKRVQAIRLPMSGVGAAGKNLAFSVHQSLLFTEAGMQTLVSQVRETFDKEPADLIVIDPIEGVFYGGGPGNSDNDEAMWFFLDRRIEWIRNSINPDAGIILVHHTRNPLQPGFTRNPFRVLKKEGQLRSYSDTSMLLCRPNAASDRFRLLIERNDRLAVPSKVLIHHEGGWYEINPAQDVAA